MRRFPSHIAVKRWSRWGSTRGAWGAAIEGSYTAADLLRICAAVLAGRSRITSLGNGRAHVEFDAVGGADLRVAAEMNGSERQAVALTL